MNNSITLSVYRNLDNRIQGYSDDSEFALELHNIRKQVLHDKLDNDHNFEIVDWGETDASKPRELVILSLALKQLAPILLEKIIWPFAKEVGKEIVDLLKDELKAKILAYVASKFKKPQEEKKIKDYLIEFSDQTWVRIETNAELAAMELSFSDGHKVVAKI